MYYTDLGALVTASKSAATYFYSLPVKLQAQLADCRAMIHTAADLHLYADKLVRYERAVKLADSLFR